VDRLPGALRPQTPHAFQMASFLPKPAQAMDQVVHFIVARTGWQMEAGKEGLLK
jgi:hypothetical protein